MITGSGRSASAPAGPSQRSSVWRSSFGDTGSARETPGAARAAAMAAPAFAEPSAIWIE